MAPLSSYVAGSKSFAMGNMKFSNGIFPFLVQRQNPNSLPVTVLTLWACRRQRSSLGFENSAGMETIRRGQNLCGVNHRVMNLKDAEALM